MGCILQHCDTEIHWYVSIQWGLVILEGDETVYKRKAYSIIMIRYRKLHVPKFHGLISVQYGGRTKMPSYRE